MTRDAAHMMVFFLVVLAIAFLSRLIRHWFREKKLRQLFLDKHLDYDDLLSRYNPYYKSLTKAGKDRFLNRLLHFIEVNARERAFGAPAAVVEGGLRYGNGNRFDLVRVDSGRGGAPRVANVGQDRGCLIVAQLPRE